ncbi:MAG: ribulose-phosphate 3-epimerase [Prevotellaceae bacterium]|jgi:ribulose-phosphate 3-epimerase|nr:ribulose-phosphate 3-epimerase [Prevotellaceae bacterium]
MKHIISPSVLAADFANLGNEIEKINNSQADWIHLDIMDGVFVPNISFGFPVIKYIKKYAKKPLDAHLMIVNPDNYIEKFHEAGVEYLTVHYEACTHLHLTLQKIRSCGMKAGVAINPHTPVNLLSEIINELDLILIMSVNPGFSGQKFIPNTYNKIAQAKELLQQKNANAIIEVDGGIDLYNAPRLYEIGANALVAGNTIFMSNDPINTIKQLKCE